MKTLLKGWTVFKHKSNINSVAIHENALQLHEYLSKQEDQTSTLGSFQASKGWYHCFQNSYNLQNICRTGESGSVDKARAERYLPQIQQIIKTGDYRPQQVFNANEIGLFYKKMGNRMLTKEVKKLLGFQTFKDRLTLLLCGNTAADFKGKPLLLYCAKSPRSLKGKGKYILGWRGTSHNSKTYDLQ